MAILIPMPKLKPLDELVVDGVSDYTCGGKTLLAIGFWLLAFSKEYRWVYGLKIQRGNNMKDFTKLRVWQEAHKLTIQIYIVTKKFPSDERYGLTSQLRRAASSIGSNLAEGCGRNSDKELARFVSIAQGSAFEVRYQIILAKDLGYISPAEFSSLENQLLSISRMLTSFHQKLTAKS